ncbi:MAG TPA: zinc metallopeptidase [Candidatus Paceibacterota bacterium]|nr:zinc metallopeptidase [Candidatus Paceibacterota bacterium]
MYFDPYYFLFMIPGLLLGIWAQIKLSSAYSKYSRVGVASGISGAEAAREILDRAGLTDVPVAEVPGHLTDHYDPTKKALFLSSENFHGRSLAAVGVAAHESGHALQHQAAYAPLNLRMAIVPITQFASQAWAGIILLGWILGAAFFAKFIWIAIAIFSIIAFFQLITLPVEFDASRRAKERLFQLGIVQSGEREGVSTVLNAAALTYVAALVSAVMSLLHLLFIARNRD